MQEEHIFPTTCKLPSGYAREQVVRCGSCRHYNSYHGKCHRVTGVIITESVSVMRIEEHAELLVLMDAEPGGFCAWGETITAEEVCQNTVKRTTRPLREVYKDSRDEPWKTDDDERY